MFCSTLHYVHSSFAIILMGKRVLVVLLSLSSWCLVMVVWLFLAVPWVCLQLVIVIFPDHTPLLFFKPWHHLHMTIAVGRILTKRSNKPFLASGKPINLQYFSHCLTLSKKFNADIFSCTLRDKLKQSFTNFVNPQM